MFLIRFKVQNFICRKVLLYFGVLYYYCMFGCLGNVESVNLLKMKPSIGDEQTKNFKNISKTQVIRSGGTRNNTITRQGNIPKLKTLTLQNFAKVGS